jgi:muramidase (phage lysozyme)
MTRDELAALAQNPQVRTFLDLIAETEGTSRHNYLTAFGGGKLSSLADHPRELHKFGKKGEQTSAAGRYQFLASTWDDVAKKYGLTDFGPESQDIAAVELLRRNGALPEILSGHFDRAIQRSGATWASLPSSPYNQPKKSMQQTTAILARLRKQGPSSQATLIAKTPDAIRAAVALAPAPAPATPAPVGGIAGLLPSPAMPAATPTPVPVPAVPAWAAPVRDMQLAGEPVPAEVQGVTEEPGWESRVMQEALTDDVDTMRQTAVSQFFGEEPVPQVRLPPSIEESINRYLAKLA